MIEVRTLKRIDIVGIPRLDARLKELQVSEEDEIIVDMEETTCISSVRLRAFVSTRKRMSKSGGSMVLKSIQPCIKEIFEVASFRGVPIVE